MKILICIVLFINTSSIGSKAYNFMFEDGCKCYSDGKSYSPGTRLCPGGNKSVCIAKEGIGGGGKSCGWDYLKDK